MMTLLLASREDATLLDALRSAEDLERGESIVLEDDSIRLLAVGDALRFWQRWWEEERSK